MKNATQLFFVASAIFTLMYACYFQGREAGVFLGISEGFDAGFRAKKPQVIIIAPPKPGGSMPGAIAPRQPDENSVLWRI